MAKKYATTSGNDYEDSAQGAASWGLRNNWNGTNVNASGQRDAERPAMKRKLADYDLSQGLKADELHPDINDVMKSWK
jgi:hypothetical protein